MLDLSRICRPGSIGRATVMFAQLSARHSLDVHLTACRTGAVAAAESEVDLQAEDDWETVVGACGAGIHRRERRSRGACHMASDEDDHDYRDVDL